MTLGGRHRLSELQEAQLTPNQSTVALRVSLKNPAMGRHQRLGLTKRPLSKHICLCFHTGVGPPPSARVTTSLPAQLRPRVRAWSPLTKTRPQPLAAESPKHKLVSVELMGPRGRRVSRPVVRRPSPGQTSETGCSGAPRSPEASWALVSVLRCSSAPRVAGKCRGSRAPPPGCGPGALVCLPPPPPRAGHAGAEDGSSACRVARGCHHAPHGPSQPSDSRWRGYSTAAHPAGPKHPSRLRKHVAGRPRGSLSGGKLGRGGAGTPVPAFLVLLVKSASQRPHPSLGRTPLVPGGARALDVLCWHQALGDVSVSFPSKAGKPPCHPGRHAPACSMGNPREGLRWGAGQQSSKEKGGCRGLLPHPTAHTQERGPRQPEGPDTQTPVRPPRSLCCMPSTEARQSSGTACPPVSQLFLSSHPWRTFFLYVFSGSHPCCSQGPEIGGGGGGRWHSSNTRKSAQCGRGQWVFEAPGTARHQPSCRHRRGRSPGPAVHRKCSTSLF